MRTYTIKSPHKMKIWEAMETAREVVKGLGLIPDLLPLIPITLELFDRPVKTGSADWESIGTYTNTEYILIIHVYRNIQNIDLKLPHLEIVDRPETE